MITPESIVNNTLYYIPSENLLDEDQMLGIATMLIAKYGDDDSNLNLISCEFLKAVGNINKTIHVVDVGGLKREKLGSHEIEMFSAEYDPWGKYLDGVGNYICPIIFGIQQKIVIGATYNSDKHPQPIIKCK